MIVSLFTGIAKIISLVPSAVEAGKAIAGLITGSGKLNSSNPSNPSNSSVAEANRHGTQSGAARNASSKATEQAMCCGKRR